ncbi:MAG: hypothetical protein DMG63_14190 [Acidobacteria bacterium]|nr:MAG: hypothetical protein DMG63_14190 [Acidobacteriota bacterium]
MLLTTSTDRIVRVHQDLGDILDDLALVSRLPQALIDRLNAMRRTLLREVNDSVVADSDGDPRSAEPLCGDTKVSEATVVAPVLIDPDSTLEDENALSRWDDEGGFNSINRRLRMAAT